MFINKINGVMSNLGFKGYQHIKNDVGESVMKFNYPFDYENETCEIQIFRVIPTDKFNYQVIEKPIATIPIDKDGTDVNMQELTDLGKDEAFAYKVIRKDKNNKVIWDGPDTGVKMRKGENGEYVFRVELEPVWTNSGEYKVQKQDGSYDYDEKGNIKTKQFSYQTQDLSEMDKYKYTLVKQNGTKPMVQGNGYLAMPDTYMPGAKYKTFEEDGTGEVYIDEAYQKEMEGMVKTFSNMYGGSMAGLEELVPYLKANGFKMLFTTPIANGDDRTSHGYWNKNNMQIAPNMGTTENFNSLMVKEFKNGISHVFDATLSSEGLEGIHMQYNMRWAEKAQSFYWFRMESLKDGNLGFGVVPENAKNLRHRLVNPPFTYKLVNGKYEPIKNDDYKANEETYFQIYDGSQVTDEQLSKLDKPIKMYKDLKAGKNLSINTHDDTVMNYIFQINPNEYQKRIDVINDLNKKEGKSIRLDTADGTVLASQFSNFRLDKVTEGGYVAWDANTDMVKMNYGISAYDEKILQAIVDKSLRQQEQQMRVRGAMEVQDMAVQVGVYWADKVKTAHTLYTAQTLGDAKTVDKIDELIRQGKLPEEVRLSSEKLNNILNGYYNLAPKGKLKKDDITVKALMKLPMDSLEFGENTCGVLSTSYFSNRATTEETIGITRFDLMKQNNPHLVEPYKKLYNRTNDMFNNELKEFANLVIQKVNEKSNEKLINSDGSYTEYGEYVVELIGQDIAKYALLKSLAGDKFKTKILSNGELTYNYDTIRQNTTLKSLGINASNPAEEAEILQNKIKKGLHKLSDEDSSRVADAISKMIKGTDVNSFRLAEAMVDLSGLGLNYRLDAAKDLMDIDSIRNRDEDFDDTWTDLIKLWGRFVTGVKSVNPYSYIVAEMTNVNEISADTFGGPDACPYNGFTNVNGVKYNGEPDAMTKFFNETGITSEAAYAYFFTELLTSFSRGFETGQNKCDTHDDFKKKSDLLINTRSIDYIRNLYTFMGNHDKMRTVHGLAVDMRLFHSTLMYRDDKYWKNREQRQDVIRIMSGAKTDKDVPLELKLNVDNKDYFRTISARAVAQTKALMTAVDEDLKDIPKEDIDAIRAAAIDLANGNYLNSKTSEKMTKINIKEISSIENAVNEVARMAKAYGLNLSDREINTIINKINTFDYNNYLVHGDFDWTQPDGVGNTNKGYLKSILGTDSDAMSYSLYTVQIARMIKNAVAGTSNETAISNALKDFVKTYNRAKINENSDNFKMVEDTIIARKKNGYAARDFRIAMEEVINQAEYKTGRKISNREDIINKVYASITEPAVEKHAMILAYLGALCGISTLYAGDELGDTGIEDKTKNIWLQNRMASMLSALKDDNSRIGAIKRAYLEKTLEALQNKTNIKVLQNGTPYSMDVKSNGMTRNELKAKLQELSIKIGELPDGNEFKKRLEKEKEFIQSELAKVAIMVQGADGDMAITVFNAGGISHENHENYFKKLEIEDKNKRRQFFIDNHLDMDNIDKPYIPIQKSTNINALLLGAGVALPVGTIFINANKEDKAQYVVEKVGNQLGIVRKEGKKICDIIMDGLTSKHGVMTLIKKKGVTFKGNSGTIYNGQYNFASNPYAKPKTIVENGKNLSLVAR